MKKLFFEHHKYSKEEFEQLISNAVLVLDTNVLLNIYRYDKQNQDKLFEVIDLVKNRLWLPYQIAKEFYKNRLKLVQNKSLFKENMTQCMESEINSIINRINNGSGEQTYSLLKYERSIKDSILKELDESKKNILNHIEAYKSEINWDYVTGDDPVLEKIASIYEDKVNKKEYLEQELLNIYTEGSSRYEMDIPPGYKDKKKPEPDRYGDLILWNEMINYACANKVDIIFVSDDVKEDWMQEINGQKIGPRIELIKEFKEKTKNLFYIYNTEKFIKVMSTKYNIEGTDKLESETKEIISYNQETNDNMELEKRTIKIGDIFWAKTTTSSDPLKTTIPVVVIDRMMTADNKTSYVTLLPITSRINEEENGDNNIFKVLPDSSNGLTIESVIRINDAKIVEETLLLRKIGHLSISQLELLTNYYIGTWSKKKLY